MTSPALVTDSSALLTPEQVSTSGARVVPVTITINGVDYVDGVDISADEFYQRLANSSDPRLSTAQPSPAQFLEVFAQAHAAGAPSAVAVLVGSAFSGTVDAARLAATKSPIPVVCVDTGHASFGVGLCALRAAAALRDGADAAEAGDAALALAATVESVFIIQAIELARASGRFEQAGVRLADGPGSGRGPDEMVPIPVLKFASGLLTVVAEVTDLDQAVEVMATEVLAAGHRVRVGSGLADPETEPVTELLEKRLGRSPLVVEILRYRVGPAVAANTGPGTAGVFYHPL